MKFRHDPSSYQQYLGIQHLYNFETTYVGFGGGAGGGKSWLGCEWIIAMCLNYPGVRYFIGREELRRLKDTTVKTFFKVAKHHGVQDSFRYYEHYSAIRFHNGSEVALLDLKRQPSDPMFERLGSTEYTGGFLEECGEIDFKAFDILRSRVGRQLNEQYNIPRKLLLTFNPKKNWLYHTFYKPWKEDRLEKGYVFIQSLARHNKKIDKGYLEALDEIKDVVSKQRLKYGEWEYENDPSALLSFDEIMSIFTNSHVVRTGEKCITADIARFGKDKSMIRVWDGGVVIERISLTLSSITDTATRIKQLAEKHHIPMRKVIVDEDGIGGGVVDILKCQGFTANSTPLNGENYDNLKSQCGYKLAELIKGDKLYEPGRSMDEQEYMREEIEQLKQKNIDNDKKLGLMPKDQIKDLIGRSPDDMDTYIMYAYFVLILSKLPRGPISRFHK